MEIGRTAPNFTLPTFDSTAFTLSDLRGKRIVLFGWSSW
ncbi:MAG: redoxin domain-containing protein [Chloroflexi bacterium]|nr:redoxin domain-containing protein [Chloroflexota bacterium]